MKKTLGISIVLVMLLFSCNKPPEACITVDNSSTSVGSNVEFSASCSKRSLSYIWSFSGPANSNINAQQRSEEAFTIAFDTIGTYTITLEAYQKFSWKGQMGTTETTVTVN